jgi:hypothetical protein
MFLVAYDSGFIARQLHRAVISDAYKAYLNSQVMLLTNPRLHVFQGVQWYRTVSHLPSEVGTDCRYFCHSTGDYDDRGDSSEFSQ